VSRSKARGAGSGGGIGIGRTPAPPPNMPPTVNSVEVEAVRPDVNLERQAIAVKQKLHPSIFAVVQKLQKKEALSNSAGTPFIRDGKAEVQVWLTEKSDEALAQLKELGFEVLLDAKNSKAIIGRLPVEKLEALAKLKFVKYVAPQVFK
jgi:hypothetical protein